MSWPLSMYIAETLARCSGAWFHNAHCIKGGTWYQLSFCFCFFFLQVDQPLAPVLSAGITGSPKDWIIAQQPTLLTLPFSIWWHILTSLNLCKQKPSSSHGPSGLLSLEGDCWLLAQGHDHLILPEEINRAAAIMDACDLNVSQTHGENAAAWNVFADPLGCAVRSWV